MFVGLETLTVLLVSGILKKNQEPVQSRAGACGLSDCNRGVTRQDQQLGGETNRGWVSALQAIYITLQLQNITLERKCIILSSR